MTQHDPLSCLCRQLYYVRPKDEVSLLARVDIYRNSLSLHRPVSISCVFSVTMWPSVTCISGFGTGFLAGIFFFFFFFFFLFFFCGGGGGGGRGRVSRGAI